MKIVLALSRYFYYLCSMKLGDYLMFLEDEGLTNAQKVDRIEEYFPIKVQHIVSDIPGKEIDTLLFDLKDMDLEAEIL